MPLPISACIITLNEEDNISRCLASLKFADEIIVLDSGSSDRTTELAKSFGAKIVRREFDDYVSQKNHVVSLAKNSWILSVDADEEISAKLENEIREILGGREPEEDGFLIPRLTMYMGKWIRHGGWYPNYRVRLFKKSKGRFVGGKVHESVRLEGKKGIKKSGTALLVSELVRSCAFYKSVFRTCRNGKIRERKTHGSSFRLFKSFL